MGEHLISSVMPLSAAYAGTVVVHREAGCTRMYYNGRMESLPYLDDNGNIKYSAAMIVGGNKYWLHEGLSHSFNDEPATILENGDRFWASKGKLYRDNGKPAYIYANGDIEYYGNHGLHREDGPARICKNGDVYFYQNGALHRERDLPAAIRADGSLDWRRNNLLHRDDSLPARRTADGKLEYFCRGVFQNPNVKKDLDYKPEDLTAYYQERDSYSIVVPVTRSGLLKVEPITESESATECTIEETANPEVDKETEDIVFFLLSSSDSAEQYRLNVTAAYQVIVAEGHSTTRTIAQFLLSCKRLSIEHRRALINMACAVNGSS